jgi:hypothetical protein
LVLHDVGGKIPSMPLPTPPTDRLHKFLAIGGIVAVLTGITTAIQKYEEAEVQRIEAIAKMNAIQIPARAANDLLERMIKIQRDALHGKKVTDKEYEKAKASFFALDPDAQKYLREMDQAIIEGQKQSQLAVHRERIRNLWFGLSFAAIALGVVAAWVGFRQWLRQPKEFR